MFETDILTEIRHLPELSLKNSFLIGQSINHKKAIISYNRIVQEQKTITNDLICYKMSKIARLSVTITNRNKLRRINKVVSGYFGFKVHEMNEKTRKREVVQARQTAMYFSKSLTRNNHTVIANHFGGLNHSSTDHAWKTINNLIDTDKQFRAQIEEIEMLLK